jgi:predicted Zn-dependent protease with MMP-like domain
VTRLKTRPQRMLLRRDQVLDELQVEEDQLEEFIEAKLLTEVQIRGHRRFDSEEVDLIKLKSPTSRTRGGGQEFLRASRRPA